MITPEPDTLPSRWDTTKDAESLVQIVGRITLLFMRAVIVPAAMASALSLFAGVWWFADLMVHFRVQYLLIGILGLLPMLLLRRPLLSSLAAICIVLNFNPVVQYFRPADGAHAGPLVASRQVVRSNPTSSRQVTVASLNVFFRNSNYAGVVAWMRRDQPDIVVLVEASKLWQEQMRLRATEWPFQHLTARPGRSGKLIISRLPISDIAVVDESPVRSPTPVATIELAGAPFRLAVVHTIWPMGEERTAGRDLTLLSLRRIAAASDLPVAAMGDFNISPFSPRFEPVVRDGILRRAAAGRGWLPTWPVFFPAAGIQIDHLLVTPEIAVGQIRTQSQLGSDHRALIARLQIPAGKRARAASVAHQINLQTGKLLRAQTE